MQQMIYDRDGERKYLTNMERKRFLDVSGTFEPDTMTLCWVISATGCRISEALALTDRSIDREAKMIIVECLKKRRRGVYRSIPVPAALIELVQKVHGIGHHGPPGGESRRLWTFSRMTAYRRICKVMDAAGLSGSQAMPKGLRHCFGVTAVQSRVPLNLVQRWLGHADMRTTAIYTGAIGPEERSIALRMWRHHALTFPSRCEVAAE